MSHLKGRGAEDSALTPSVLFQCHTRRVKKIAVGVQAAGNILLSDNQVFVDFISFLFIVYAAVSNYRLKLGILMWYGVLVKMGL